MKWAAVEALAALVPDPTVEKIIIGPFDTKVATYVASAVAVAAQKS